MRTTRAGNNLSGGKPSPACRHIQRQMPLFLDGELSTQQAQHVARHLSLCPLCQRERDQWQQSERALAGARQHLSAPGDLRTGFYARLAAAPASHRSLPRIDWRAAVPALAACGLAFGWLTAKNSAAPSVTRSMTAASTPLPHQQIAQSNNPRHVGIAANKAPVSAFPSFGVPGSNPTQHFLSDAAATIAPDNTNRKIERGQIRHIGQQIASAGLRHRNPTSRMSLKARHLAAIAPLGLYYGIEKTARVLEARLGEEKSARVQNRKQDSAFFADYENDANWKLSLQSNKSVAQKDNYALAKTTNSDGATKMKANTFGYIAPAAKSDKSGELKKQSLLDTTTLDAPADVNRSYAFALGVNELADRSSYGANRALGWGAAVGENEGIYLEVEDTKRGFTSSTRLASRTQEQNGQRVLIIQAEDAEPLTGEETQSAPVSEQK